MQDARALLYAHRLLACAGLEIQGFFSREPKKGILEVIERANVPAFQCADKREESRATVRVFGIENRQALRLAKANLMERIDEFRQVGGRENRRRECRDDLSCNSGAGGCGSFMTLSSLFQEPSPSRRPASVSQSAWSLSSSAFDSRNSRFSSKAFAPAA